MIKCKKKILSIISLILASSLTLTGCSLVYTPYDLVKGIEFLFAVKNDSAIAYEDEEVSSKEQEEEREEENDETTDSTEVLTQTIMIYMVGSNLESECGSASMDIQEMMDANIDTDINNIVVYAGGSSKWYMPELDSDCNTTLLLQDNDFEIIDSSISASMGNPNTLSDFISFCFDEFDTDLYSLILWDHGAGPVIGFGVDENYGDILNLTELQEALDSSVGKYDEKLEWIGFDACLMSSLEIADALEPYANYLIASQETEPGWGWNYDFLSSLSKPGMDGANLGKEIIDAYMDFGEFVFDEYPNAYSDLTLACMDLNKYADVEEALNECFKEQGETLSVNTFPEIIRDRGQLRQFGSFSSSYNYSMIDSIQLLNSMSGNNTAASKAADAIENMIVYQKNNMDDVHGVSICYPYMTEKIYQDNCINIQETMEFAPEYTKFLKNLYALSDGSPIVQDWDIADAETQVNATEFTEANITSSGSEITLALTEEQQQNFATASYVILCNAYDAEMIDDSQDARARENYLYVYAGKNVEMDEDGLLHAYYANNVLYVHDTEDDSLSPIPMLVIDNHSSSKEKRYLSYALLESFGEDIDIMDWKTDGVELQIAVNDRYPNGIIRNAFYLNDDDTFNSPGKQLVDINDYEYLAVSIQGRYPTRDLDGHLLPIWDWDTSDWYLGFEQKIDTYDLKVVPLQNPEDYYCMFIITDAQGNQTASELIPLG